MGITSMIENGKEWVIKVVSTLREFTRVNQSEKNTVLAMFFCRGMWPRHELHIQKHAKTIN